MGKVTQNKKHNTNTNTQGVLIDKQSPSTNDNISIPQDLKRYEKIGFKRFTDVIVKQQLHPDYYPANHDIECNCEGCLVHKQYMLIDFCKEHGERNKCEKLLSCKRDCFNDRITTFNFCECSFCKRIHYHTAYIYCIKVRKYIRYIKNIKEKNRRLILCFRRSKSKNEKYRIQCVRATLFHEYKYAIIRKGYYLKRFLDLKELGYTDKSINTPSTSSLYYKLEVLPCDYINKAGEIDELTPEDLKEFEDLYGKVIIMGDILPS